MNQMENATNNPEQKKRPVFLLVLSILSFITIGFGLIGSIISIISGPLSDDEIETTMANSMSALQALNDAGMNDLSDTFERIFRMQEYINANFYTQTLITIGGLIIGFLGVILMMRGNKRGFHLYIIYNIISLVSIYVSVPVSEVPSFVIITNAVFSILFIFLYSRNLHWMK